MTAKHHTLAGTPSYPGSLWAGVDEDFPLVKMMRDQGLVYLDNAATTQKPETVIQAMDAFYRTANAAVHRGAHRLGEAATAQFENARAKVAVFIGADAESLVFAPNATGAINLVAHSLGSVDERTASRLSDLWAGLRPGDSILLTESEHHSNLVPWLDLARRVGANLEWIRVGADGRLDLGDLDKKAARRTRVVAFTHASNVTGAVTPVADLVDFARSVGALTVLDATQTAGHMPVDFSGLGVDFMAISAHKMLGPTGIGALCGRTDLLRALPPVNTGGSMVNLVTLKRASYLGPPQRFEAGTQAVAEAVGWGAATDYLAGKGMDVIASHEDALTGRALAGLASIPAVRIAGPIDPTNRLGIISFTVQGIDNKECGAMLDGAGIAVRVGQHCAQPLHRALGFGSTVRASIGLVNTQRDIDRLVDVTRMIASRSG